ncbi:L,D-transpeptidase family protein [Oryzifoliimicrobium ureilyticus]|uniref:L,D-transpeptidase family protein n=1 Tax=Oryzifoliimicrobium ureilyticus TaxID=3113724 RepID=UPI0030768645
MPIRSTPCRIASLFVVMTLLSAPVVSQAQMVKADPLAGVADKAYTVPARRAVQLPPRGDDSGLGTLFDTAASRQTKILSKMSGIRLVMNDDVAATIEAYYSQPKAKLIWTDGEAHTAKAAQAIDLLKQADSWGLNPADYIVPTDFENMPKGSDERAAALAQFEISLSNKMAMFLQDNFRGRIDPNKLSNYYDFKRKPVDLKAMIAELSNAPDLMPVFNHYMPSNPKFAQLAAELQWLKKSDQAGGAKADIDKVTVAMEELRWMPQEFPQRYVFINQPAYMAYYYENGQMTFSTKAVIGQQDHQTNFFDATIKTVEFNPDWGVPQSIIKNEMLPHLKRDPAYLDKEGYVVTVKGKEMPSAKVDWSQPLDNIGVVQPPGPDNALGQLKILFPNAHAIYMHDTPARGKFASQDRMFSHGCVRLEDPRGMAAAVLKNTVDFVNQQISDGQKKDMPVPEPLAVYVAYFTAWPSEDGTVHYYDDIYGRDLQTLNAIAATSASRSQS